MRLPVGPWDHPQLLGWSLVARLPYGMSAVGILASALGRGLGPAMAGTMTGIFTLGLAVAAPLWGRLADRMPNIAVVLACAAIDLAGTGLLTVSPSRFLLHLGSLLIGAGVPPLGAMMRVIWNDLLSDAAARNRAAIAESVVVEGIHIVGRLAVAVLSAVSATLVLPVQALLAVAGAGGLALTRGFSRPGRAVVARVGAAPGSLRPVLPVFITVTTMSVSHGGAATGMLLLSGGDRYPWRGALLMTVWGLGSMLGGLLALVFSRWHAAHDMIPAGLVLFAAVAVGLQLCIGSRLLVSAGVVLLLGLPLAPTFAQLYQAVGRSAPGARANEAFAVVNALIVLGFGVGVSVSGWLSSSAVPARPGLLVAAGSSLAAAGTWAGSGGGRRAAVKVPVDDARPT
jgi:hypothetical protein